MACCTGALLGTLLMLMLSVIEADVPTGLDMKLLKDVTSGRVDNHVISPFLMSLLMSQVWLGARGPTRDEMTPVLGMSGPQDTSFLAGYQSALAALSRTGGGVTTSVFNRMYRRQGFTVKKSFNDLLKRYYGAGLTTLSGDSKEAAEVINAAVNRATRGEIEDLVTPGDLDNFQLVLLSAIFFKGTWLYRFDRKGQETFLTPEGERPVAMMNLTAELRYALRPGFDVVELPYKDKDFCLLVFRPRQRTLAAVTQLRSSLDTLDVSQLVDELSLSKVRVVMPPFKAERRYELPANMKRLGIRRIFSLAADLSGITPGGGIYVSDIIHKAMMEVTEEGTKAAAVGVVIIKESGGQVEFTVDRPFYVVLYHKPQKLNLFSALVARP